MGCEIIDVLSPFSSEVSLVRAVIVVYVHPWGGGSFECSVVGQLHGGGVTLAVGTYMYTCLP